MKKAFLTLGLLTLMGAGLKAQSSLDSIPLAIKEGVKSYRQGIDYCKGELKITKIDTKYEDRTGDNIKDQITLYSVEGKPETECYVIPNFFIYIQRGTKSGVYDQHGTVETAWSKDDKGKTVELKDW
jgi:hypothetical protein